MSELIEGVDVREATHIKLLDNSIERIAEKWGIGPNGKLAPPSQGGFGVVTESGKRISMWEARGYLREQAGSDLP